VKTLLPSAEVIINITDLSCTLRIVMLPLNAVDDDNNKTAVTRAISQNDYRNKYTYSEYDLTNCDRVIAISAV